MVEEDPDVRVEIENSTETTKPIIVKGMASWDRIRNVRISLSVEAEYNKICHTQTNIRGIPPATLIATCGVK